MDSVKALSGQVGKMGCKNGATTGLDMLAVNLLILQLGKQTIYKSNTLYPGPHKLLTSVCKDWFIIAKKVIYVQL